MSHHWEIGWTTLRPLTDDEVRRSVEAIKGLGCCLPDFAVEFVEDAYVGVRHRRNDDFLFEFGFESEASAGVGSARGLVRDGHIVWNWCCTHRRHPETGLVLRKLRQIQALTGDKLLVWDDDGQSHWSWGSYPIEATGLRPLDVVDAHLGGAPLPARQGRAA